MCFNDVASVASVTHKNETYWNWWYRVRVHFGGIWTSCVMA
jgi:hypothetical protein